MVSPTDHFRFEYVDMNSWTNKVDRFYRLKDGWDGYFAPVPSMLAIEAAKQFLHALEQFKSEPSRVAPSVEGGVGVTHKNGRRRVYVEFFNNGEVYALFSDDVEMPQTKRIPPDAARFNDLSAEIRKYLNA